MTPVASLTYVCSMVDYVRPTQLQTSTELQDLKLIFLQSDFEKPTETSSSVRKHLEQVLFSTLFTHNHATKCLSSVVNIIVATAFYRCPPYSAVSKEYF